LIIFLIYSLRRKKPTDTRWSVALLAQVILSAQSQANRHRIHIPRRVDSVLNYVYAVCIIKFNQ